MRSWLAFVFVSLSMVGFAHAAHPRQIEFKNIPANVIASLRNKLPQVFQATASYAEVDELLQEVMSTGNFEDVTIESEIEHGTEKIIVVGRPIRRIQNIILQGHHQISQGDIQDILGLQIGETFNRKRLVDGAEKLKARYGEMGFFNSAIEISFDAGKDNQISVKIDVVEGGPCLIHDIVIDTNNKSLHEALMRRVARNLRHPLTDQRITSMRDVIEEYFSANRYLSAQLSAPQIDYNDEKTHATVTFKVENPTRIELIFDGNLTLTSPSILRRLDLENYPRSTLNPPLDINNRIIEIYREKGYAFATVDFKEKSFEKSFLKRVYFKIKENKRVRIASIEFTGRITRESKYYSDFLSENSTDLIRSGYYSRTGIDLGLKNLQIDLQNQGFLQTKVMGVRVSFDEDKKRALVSVNLDEGPLTMVREILFKGNHQFSTPELRELLKITGGAPLRLSEVEASVTTLKEFYTSHGYLEMNIQNENQDLVQYNDGNTEAILVFDISEGPQVKIAKIVIEGNQLTKEYVILREIDFKEGEILTPAHIAESTGRLQRLGLFSQVSITTAEQGTAIANRTVVVAVNEANPGIFNSGLGFTDAANLTYTGFLGIAYRNIGGTARAVSSRAELSYASDPRISYLENKFQLAYFEPFVFNTRTRSRVSYTHAQFVQDYDFSPDTLTHYPRGLIHIRQSDDVRLLLERDLSLHTRFKWTAYGLERSHIFEKNNQQPESDRFIATIGPTLDVDYRDNPFNPTLGSFSSFTTEYSDPILGSDDTIKYWKSDAQYTKYHRPFGTPRIVWANQIRGGALRNLSDREDGGVPYEKAFFLGGRSTVRGFEPSSERFPRAEQLNPKNDPNFAITNWLMKTDSQYFLVKSELRFPIYGSLGGAIFYDGGAVYIDGVPMDTPYRDSVGVGLRVSTPVGPVNLEAGYKLNRKMIYNETPYRIHFSIGTF